MRREIAVGAVGVRVDGLAAVVAAGIAGRGGMAVVLAATGGAVDVPVVAVLVVAVGDRVGDRVEDVLVVVAAADRLGITGLTAKLSSSWH